MSSSSKRDDGDGSSEKDNDDSFYEEEEGTVQTTVPTGTKRRAECLMPHRPVKQTRDAAPGEETCQIQVDREEREISSSSDDDRDLEREMKRLLREQTQLIKAKRRKEKRMALERLKASNAALRADVEGISRPKQFHMSVTAMSGGNAAGCEIIGAKDFRVTIEDSKARKIISERTDKRIQTRTENMVETSALRTVREKIKAGVTWITIKGSPGEGKTTVAYQTLRELQESGRDVFEVISPEEFTVVSNFSQCVIMLDDILGGLEFDQAAWSRWEPVLRHILGEKDHTSHEHYSVTTSDNKTLVILVGRDYVLYSARSNLGKLTDYTTKDDYVVNMSHTDGRTYMEKLSIWNAISRSSGVTLDENTVDRICHIECPHGFPHVCRLFATMKQENPELNAKDFFRTPLEFLNQTMKKFMSVKEKNILFKSMIKGDGKVSGQELRQVDPGYETLQTAKSLVGTYLREEDDTFSFDHSSIYDSVAYNLCSLDPVFVIENCSLSFIHERLRLEPSSDMQHGTPSRESGLVVHIPRSCSRSLAARFAVEISKRNFVPALSHKAFRDEVFIDNFMSQLTVTPSKLVELTDGNSETDSISGQFLSLLTSNKSRNLLRYIDNHPDIHLSESDINTVLYGVCKYAASDILSYMIECDHPFDINVKYGYNKQTPLMIAAESRDSQFVHQIMSLNPDLNARDDNEDTVLNYMCENGLVSAAKQMLDMGTDIDIKGDLGWSPLWCACSSNQTEVVRLLVDRGAKLDVETVGVACERGNIQIVKKLFEAGATVNMKTWLGTPLHTACCYGHVKVIRYLIEQGASANTAGLSGMSPLHLACDNNRPKAVQCLLDHGASTDSRNGTGDTPLHTAAEMGSEKCCDVLITAGADVNAKNKNGQRPLHTAARSGSEECVDLLTKAGANVNAKSKTGSTPLHSAAEKKAEECICVLLKAGANVNVHSQNNNTPLHTAVEKVSKECVDVLLEAGADVSRRNKTGNTPLHIAAEKGSKECIDVLLKAGACVNLRSTYDETPLYIAAKTGSSNCIERLLMAGADVNLMSGEGNSPLHIASGKGSKTCVDVLLKAGVDLNHQNQKGQTPLHMAVCYRDQWDNIYPPDVSVCQTLIASTRDINIQDRGGNTPLHLLCRADGRTLTLKNWDPEPLSTYEDVYRRLVTLLLDSGAEVNIMNKNGEPALRGWCKALYQQKRSQNISEKVD